MEADDIRQRVGLRVVEEQEILQVEKEQQPEITPEFIAECLLKNEVGDAMLFARLFKGKFVFNKNLQQWFYWKGHFWDIDMMGLRYSAVELAAQEHEGEATRLNDGIKDVIRKEQSGLATQLKKLQKDFRDRAKRLRTVRGLEACLTMVHNLPDGLSLAIVGSEFDCKPWLLACQNGTIDLRTGKHFPGRQGDYLYKAVPHDYKGIDEPCPLWEKFIAEVMDGNQELISYIQRLFGYGITGFVNEHIIPILSGEGRNGKGTLVETLRYILGPLAEPIQSEMLLDQKNPRSSASSSPDIMSLKGLRIAFTSEIDEGRRFSPAKAKWLSGGDTLVGRSPYDKYEVRFTPTHLLCLLTNHLPHAPSDDYAFWSRLRVIPFKLHFIDNPQKENERRRDKDFVQKLKAEASGIIAWFVKGCLIWQKQGENPPECVIRATEAYRFSEDTVGRFVEICTYKAEDIDNFEVMVKNKVLFKDIYELFQAWFLQYEGSERHLPSRKKLSELLGKIYKKEKSGGRIYFTGLALRPLSDITENAG